MSIKRKSGSGVGLQTSEAPFAAADGYAAALAEIERVKEVLDELHHRVGKHHSGLGIRNAIQELCDSEAWLRMSLGEPHTDKLSDAGPVASDSTET